MIPSFKYWEITVEGRYLCLNCPALRDAGKMRGFGIKRKIYKELKEIEVFVKENGFRGWITWTHPGAPNVMDFLERLGANATRMWYRKDIKAV